MSASISRQLDRLAELAEALPVVDHDHVLPDGRRCTSDSRGVLLGYVAELRAAVELEAQGAPWWGLDPTTRELLAEVVDDLPLDGPLLDTHDLGQLADRFDAARIVVMDGPRVGRLHREQLAALLLLTATALQRLEDRRAAFAEIRNIVGGGDR